MQTYDPSHPLLGLHIPKCAGSSMKQVLRGWFGRQIHWHYFDEVRNRPPRVCRPSLFHHLRRRLTGRGVCIYGHFNRTRGFGVEDYYPNAQQFFTIVRDPLATVQSQYFAAKRLGARRIRQGKPAPIAECYTSVDAFVAAEVGQPYFTNYLPGPITLDNYVEIFESRFIYVGVAEDLQTAVDQLAARLGFASVSVPHVNVSRHDETLDPALAAEFVASRPLEYAIYHYALEHCRDAPST